jgi:hypothetical protein
LLAVNVNACGDVTDVLDVGVCETTEGDDIFDDELEYICTVYEVAPDPPDQATVAPVPVSEESVTDVGATGGAV